MMGEIDKLLGDADGKLDVKDYERTVATLMSGGSDPVITKKPEGAYSFAIIEAMKGHGVYKAGIKFYPSTAHTDEDAAWTLRAFEAAVAEATGR